MILTVFSDSIYDHLWRDVVYMLFLRQSVLLTRHLFDRSRSCGVLVAAVSLALLLIGGGRGRQIKTIEFVTHERIMTFR